MSSNGPWGLLGSLPALMSAGEVCGMSLGRGAPEQNRLKMDLLLRVSWPGWLKSRVFDYITQDEAFQLLLPLIAPLTCIIFHQHITCQIKKIKNLPPTWKPLEMWRFLKCLRTHKMVHISFVMKCNESKEKRGLVCLCILYGSGVMNICVA